LSDPDVAGAPHERVDRLADIDIGPHFITGPGHTGSKSTRVSYPHQAVVRS
jgi:hypothetical protein